MAELAILSTPSEPASPSSPSSITEGGASDAVSFNENSFVASTQLTQNSITISYTPTQSISNDEPLMTPVHTKRFSAVSQNQLNKSDGFIPRLDLDDDTTADNKLAGEVDGLMHMHNSRTSDKTAYGEAHRVESTCRLEKCTVPSSKNFLKCSTCLLPVHYECSKLPQYQLYMFVKKTRKFTCEDCVDLSDWPHEPSVKSPTTATAAPSGVAPSTAASITKADMTLLFNHLEKNLVDVLNKSSSEISELRGVIHTKEKDTLNKEKSAVEKALSQIKKEKDALTRQVHELTTDKNLLEDQLRENIPKVDELTRDNIIILDQLNEKTAELEKKAKEVERLLLCVCLKDADLKEYQAIIRDFEDKLSAKDNDYKAMFKAFEDKLSAYEKKPVSKQSDIPTQEETQVTADIDSSKSDKSDKTGDIGTSPNITLSDKFKYPDILCVTNSLGKDIDAGKIFAPKFTNRQVLHDKSIEGAISFVNTCDIHPKEAVVLHVIENSISIDSDNSDYVNGKVEELVSAVKTKWPNTKIFLVEPIGRKFKDEQKTDFYVNNAQTVRQNLSNVVSHDCIIKTPLLHEVKFDTFVQDWVHLKPRGLGALCLSYKKVVYKGLGIPHDSASFTDRNQHKGPRPLQRTSSYDGSRKFSRYRGHDNRGDDLSKLMKNFEIGLRGFIKH